MSVSVRTILLVCVAIFSLNFYLYSEYCGPESFTEKEAVQEVYTGESADSQDDEKVEGVYINVD